jgi:gas vesicle protein
MYRRISLIILAIALGALLSQPPAAIGQTATQKAGEAVDAIKAYSVDKKNDAVAHSKKLLSDIDGRIKELQTEASRSSGETKAAMQQQLKELQVMRDKAAKKADELGKASADTWDSVKGGFADAYSDLQKGYDKAAATLRK